VAIDPSGLLVVGNMSTNQLWISHDGGVTGETVALPTPGPFGLVGISFVNDHYGLAIGEGSQGTKNPGGPEAPVLATDDGGSTWHQISQLDIGMGSVGYGSSVAVVTNPGSGPLSASTVATSTDGGAKWKTWSIPDSNSCLAAAAAGDTAVLFCPNVTPAGLVQTSILVSRDAGRDWHAYRLESSQPLSEVAAAGSGDLWTFGLPGLLWQSRDGGAHWAALTLTLPVAS
jgi:photosystem II stability/assembly factor-like uncharacterized protein